MAQDVPQRAQLGHLPLQIIGPATQLIAGDVGLAVPAEHASDLDQREPAALPMAMSDSFSSTSASNCRRRPRRQSEEISPISS